MRRYDRLARLRVRQGTPKLFSVQLSNFGIIFSDSIYRIKQKKIDFLIVPGIVPPLVTDRRRTTKKKNIFIGEKVLIICSSRTILHDIHFSLETVRVFFTFVRHLH